MKRSDVLKNLTNMIANNRNVSAEALAEGVLILCQQHGMKPPCRAGWGGHGKLDEDGCCDDYVESCDFRWEEEKTLDRGRVNK